MKTILNPQNEEPERIVALAILVRQMEWNVERVTADVAMMVKRRRNRIIPDLRARRIIATLH